MSKNIFLDYIDSYDINVIQKSLEKAFFSLDVNQIFKPKAKVLIKVCLPGDYSPDMAETTNPAVVRALVNILSGFGCKCIVADSPYKKYTNSNLDQVYVNSGMLEVANLTKCELNTNLKTYILHYENGIMSKQLTLLDVINEVDFIVNVGKVKFDDELGYLGASSNMFGLIPGNKKEVELNRCLTLKDFNNYIVDIVEAMGNKLVLNILDCIVAQEKGKTQRMMYCLGVGTNCFNLDAAILDIIKVPFENTILKQAEERNLFNHTKPYKSIGESVNKFSIEDFVYTEFDNSTHIHKNSKQRVKFYKSNQARTKIEPSKCKGCSICSKICPTKAIAMKYDKNGELYAEIDYKKCILCNKCLTACPYFVVEKVEPRAYKNLEKEIKKYND